MTETEMIQKMQDTHEGDMLRALSELRASGVQTDFATGYAAALQKVSLRNGGSLLETLKRLLAGDDLAGDLLGYFQVSAATLLVASRILGSADGEKLYTEMKEAEGKFVAVFTKKIAVEAILESVRKARREAGQGE